MQNNSNKQNNNHKKGKKQQQQKPKKKHIPQQPKQKVAKIVVPRSIVAHGYKNIKTVFGSGDYEVSSNTISRSCGSLPLGVEIPRFSIDQRGTRITHREFVGDLKSPGAGLEYRADMVQQIMPSNVDLFPWLANIAQSYQQYKFNGLVIEFKSMSSEYAATSALGSIVISANYNANMPPYINKSEAENSEFAVSSKPSVCQMHSIECNPRERPTEYLYVQRANVMPITFGPTTYNDIVGFGDKRLSSFGTLQIATQGLNAAVGTVLGEIWVSYDITFLKPVINTPYSLSPDINPSRSVTRMSTNASTTGITVAKPYGINPDLYSSVFPAVTYSVGPTGKSRLTFLKKGAYHLCHHLVGAGCGLGTPALPAGVTCPTIKNYTTNDTGSSTGYTQHEYVKTTADEQYYDFTGSGSAPTSGSTTIVEYLGDAADIILDAVFALF